MPERAQLRCPGHLLLLLPLPAELIRWSLERRVASVERVELEAVCELSNAAIAVHIDGRTSFLALTFCYLTRNVVAAGRGKRS